MADTKVTRLRNLLTPVKNLIALLNATEEDALLAKECIRAELDCINENKDELWDLISQIPNDAISSNLRKISKFKKFNIFSKAGALVSGPDIPSNPGGYLVPVSPVFIGDSKENQALVHASLCDVVKHAKNHIQNNVYTVTSKKDSSVMIGAFERYDSLKIAISATDQRDYGGFVLDVNHSDLLFTKPI